MIKQCLLCIAVIILLIENNQVFAKSFMRCRTHVVELGDTINDVYHLCGVPESIEYRTAFAGTGLIYPYNSLDQYQEIHIEEWIYNFGRTRFQQYLRFENGILVDIQDLKKGH